MLVNDAISIISNGRLALGDLGLEIAQRIQKGLYSTPETNELQRRLVLTYAILKVLDKIVVINEDDEVEYILGDYDTAKINRMLMYLRSISKAGNRPVLSKILNPIASTVGNGTNGQDGDPGQDAYLYIGYAEDASGTGYSSAPDVSRTYIAFRQSTTPISPPTAATFAGLWQKYIGTDGDQGDEGDPGQSQYIFQAWANADDGTGFTLTFNAALKYTAFLIKDNDDVPVQADFAGLWTKYVGDDGDQGDQGNDGASAFVYIGYADDASGTGFTLTFDADKDYIAIISTDTEIPSPAVGDFAGLWKNYKGTAGGDGNDGNNGTDGQSAFTYIGYAEDIEGTGFTSTFDPDKEYIAILSTSSEIVAPEASDFTGLWTRYRGNGDRYKTYSTTTLTIGTGSQYLNVENGLAYTAGQRCIIAVPNNPSNRMEGMVVFYDVINGQLEVDVDLDFGAGTFSTWDVNLAGAPVSVAGVNAYYATLATDQGSGGSTQTLSTSPAKVTAFDTVVSQSPGMSASTSTDDITVDNNGAYAMDFNATVSGDPALDVLFQVYKNGVAVPNFIARLLLDGSGNPQNVSIHGIIESVQQADVFDIRATASAGTPDVLLEQARLSVYTVGFLNSEQYKDFENADVDTGTETVDTFAASAGSAAKFEVLIKKSTNFRQVTLWAVWDGVNQPEVSEEGIGLSIGTIDVTVAVDYSSGSIRLRATASSDNWIVKGKRTIIG